LEAELRVLKGAIEEEHLEHYRCIIAENEKLLKENQEIKDFLSDYGLKWVGSMPQTALLNSDKDRLL